MDCVTVKKVRHLLSGNDKLGVFSVPVKLRNWQNQFLPQSEQRGEVSCEAHVNIGAQELTPPSELIARLRLQPRDTVTAYTADGARQQNRMFGIVEIEVQGRRCHVRAVELPSLAEPLLGAAPLETMDWHVSPLEKKLLPNSGKKPPNRFRKSSRAAIAEKSVKLKLNDSANMAVSPSCAVSPPASGAISSKAPPS